MEETHQEYSSEKASTTSKTPIIIFVIIVLILVIGGGLYIVKKKLRAAPTVTNTTNQQTASPTTVEEKAATTTATQEQATEFTITGANFFFKPNEIQVKKGAHVKITFKNEQGFHDFRIEGLNIGTDRINGGQQATVEFTADKAGTFAFFCSVGNHRAMGMQGKLIVE